MDWYEPDPNVKESLEIARDAMQIEYLERLIHSLDLWLAQFSRCRNYKLP